MIYKLTAFEEGPEGYILIFNPPLTIAADKSAIYLKELVGSEFEQDDFARIVETLARPALEYAAKQLGMRPLTRKELTRKLSDKGYDALLSEYALDRLESIGGLDDYMYAQLFVEDRAGRGWGAIRIRNELRTKGVSQDIIERALEELPDSEEQIERFIHAKADGKILDRKAIKRISDALIRRGFSWDEIGPVLARYIEE